MTPPVASSALKYLCGATVAVRRCALQARHSEIPSPCCVATRSINHASARSGGRAGGDRLVGATERRSAPRVDNEILGSAAACPAQVEHVLILGMDYGLVLFTSDRGITPAAAAKLADDHGFDTFYVPEHTHIPVKREAAHPTTGDESLPDDRYMRTLDPWVSLGAACAVTSRVRLSTAVALPVEHDPITLAKTHRHPRPPLRRPGQPRRRIRLEHRRARRPRRAARAAPHHAARVPRGDARAVDRGGGRLRRRVRQVRARAGPGPSRCSRTSRCWSARPAPRRTSSGSPAAPTAGSPRRATSTSTSRSSCCRTPGPPPAATALRRSSRWTSSPIPEKLARWAELGVTEVLFGLPDQPRGRGRRLRRTAGRQAGGSGLARRPVGRAPERYDLLLHVDRCRPGDSGSP